MTGTIKKLVSDKGFGFIHDPASGADVFFHRSSLDDAYRFEQLREGQTVEFDYDVGQRAKGPRAAWVRVLEGNS